MGKRIVEAVGSGEVGLFIATPGSANLQPRIEGAEKAIKDSGKPITAHSVATGAAVAQEQPAIEAWYQSHKSAKGMYAVDGGSTECLAKVMQKLGLAGKVHAGGFDLTEQTQKLLKEGDIEFTIDQQPYLQGFMPVLELFLWQVSGTLTGPAEVDTGLKFLNKETVGPVRQLEKPLRGNVIRSQGGPDPGRYGSVNNGGGGPRAGLTSETDDAGGRLGAAAQRRPLGAASAYSSAAFRCARAASSSSRSSWRSTSPRTRARSSPARTSRRCSRTSRH